MPKKILAFAGSARAGSWNKKLLAVAVAGARAAGAEVTHVDLRDFPMPIYDGDCEDRDGLPDNAKKMKALFLQHDGLLLGCPEYNSSITPLLKNTIDWVSRPLPGEAPFAPFNGKIAALVSASPGALGGIRGLVVVKMLLGNIKIVVIPDTFSLVHADKAFDPQGNLTDPKQLSAAQGVGKALAAYQLGPR